MRLAGWPIRRLDEDYAKVLDDVAHLWFQVHIELIWFLRTATRLAL
jgi:hypothetical protein